MTHCVIEISWFSGVFTRGFLRPFCVFRGSALDENDAADQRRELELYRSQNLDEEKKKFFATISRDPEQFPRLIALASNAAVVWAFVAEHGAEAQVTEQKRLKHELHVTKARARALENHNERLMDDWTNIQQTSEAEIERLQADFHAVSAEVGSLKTQVLDADRVKQTQAREAGQIRGEMEELQRRFALELQRLQEATKVSV